MSQFNLQKTMIGALAFFIEGGKTVDGVNVSKSAKPDVDPTTNWQKIGCVSELTPYRQTEQDTPVSCFDGIRYRTENTTITVEDGWDIRFREFSEPVYRLLLGLSAEIQDDTPVIPFQQNIREIEGWLKLQGRNVNNNGDVWVKDLWCKMELIEVPTFNNRTVLPQLRFTSLGSDYDVVQLTNVENLPLV